MCLRKITVITAISIIAMLGIASTASAGGRDYVFSVVPQTQFVSVGQNGVLNWSASNNTSTAADCTVVNAGDGFVVFSGVIQPGTSAGGGYTTPALYKNTRFELVLSCNGSVIRSDYSNVKVR